MNITCPIHGEPWKVIPAGVSKKTQRPYPAFKVCPIDGCNEKPIELDKSEPLDNVLSGGVQAPQTAQETIDKRSYRIERQHSQEMALRYIALKGKTDFKWAELVEVIDKFMEDLNVD